MTTARDEIKKISQDSIEQFKNSHDFTTKEGLIREDKNREYMIALIFIFLAILLILLTMRN